MSAFHETNFGRKELFKLETVTCESTRSADFAR